MISSFVFDLDGTLFDSSHANIVSYSAAFEKSGLTFDVELYTSNFGLRFSEMMDILAPEASQQIRRNIKAAKVEFYRQNLDLIIPNHGLLALAEEIGQTHKTALVTTASSSNVENLLNHFLPDKKLFNAVITGEEVSIGKPDPEAYLLAFKALDSKPEDCLIFEDSEVGIIAAERSGAKVIKVGL